MITAGSRKEPRASQSSVPGSGGAMGVDNNRTLKIVIAGPKGSGKTVIANFLADDQEALGSRGMVTPPTQGVRIRECERELLPGSSMKVPVELWDCSGDQNFEPCWPAVLNDAHGVILVYNPEKAVQEQEITLWYDYFVRGAGLEDQQCLLLIHRSSSAEGGRLAAPPKLSRVETVNTTYESGGLIKKAFEEFLRSLMGKGTAHARRH